MADVNEDAMLLGVDGRIHDGSVVHRFSGPIMDIACGVEAMRELSQAECAVLSPDRMCPECFEELDDEAG